jgi:3-oxoacyl-[acyl-carrier protein] reductase
MSEGTMRRRSFSPYSPSKPALKSETINAGPPGAGVTVNALLLGALL